MTGGAGNDTFVLDDAGDHTFEAFDGGTDTVNSRGSHTLADNVENLTLLDVGTGSEDFESGFDANPLITDGENGWDTTRRAPPW
jgi:hypothetical protein